MERILTAVTLDGTEHHLVLRAAEDTPLSAVAARLAEACGAERGTPLFGGDTAMPAVATLADSALRDGCRVGLGVPVAPADTAPTDLIGGGPGGTLLFSRPPRLYARIPDLELSLTDFRMLRSVWRGEMASEYAGEVRDRYKAALREAALDAGDLLAIAEGPGYRLWERRPTDPDYLSVRCGVGRTYELGEIKTVGLLTRFLFRGNDARPMRFSVKTEDVPVSVPIKDAGVLGIAGRGDLPRRLATWCAGQIAVLHSPVDVTLRVLTDSVGLRDWSWLRWLPPGGTRRGEGLGPLVSVDRESHAWQISALLTLVADRGRAGAERGARREPDVVVFLDGVQDLRSLPGLTALLKAGPEVGVYVVCLADDDRQLPAECRAVVTERQDGMLRVVYATPRRRESEDVRADAVPPEWYDRVARALAPLRDAHPEEQPSAFQERRLLELLNLDPPEAGVIAERWRASPRATGVPVGHFMGIPSVLDLTRDGPHALVAGVSGSGKTEFLRTWLTSLAVANRPDELSLVLVNQKGGREFGVLERLPHVVGLIEDFDNHLARRTQTLLMAEVHRRERALRAAGAQDLEEYQRLRDAGADLPPMPRLVIVIDEFASLVAELPGLVHGLIEISRRGRLLGFHLIMSTQRPGGAVQRDVLLHTNLRIAFRLAGKYESREVIGAPDASRIGREHPGRAYVRIGSDELIKVQAARVGSQPQSAAEHRRVTVLSLYLTGAVGSTVGRAPAEETETGGPGGPVTQGPDDLDVLVEAVRAAAQALDVAVPRPLTPPLESVLDLAEVPVPSSGRDLAPVVFGWEDIPEEQSRRPAVLDLARHGALLVAGAPRSGRSQLLRTLAGAVARQHTTADVHIYGIDCGDGALQALTDLPHCGAVVTRNQEDRAARLLGRLTATVRQRQSLLAVQGFGSLAQQRQAVPEPHRLPYLLLLIDRWEGFLGAWEDKDGGQFVEQVLQLLREGRKFGVCVVITGDRTLLTSRMTALTEQRLLLNLADRQDYFFAGLDPAFLPAHLAPGRAVRADSGVEVQIALVGATPTRRGQTDALADVAAGAQERDIAVPPTQRPFRIEDIPSSADRFQAGGGKGRPVGREDVLAWLRDRHATGVSAALLGPRRAGKTWVLAELDLRLRADDLGPVHQLTVPQPGGALGEGVDALAELLDRGVRGSSRPAEALLDKASAATGTDRPVFLLDEVGRLARYDPAAVSWLRDLGQAGAWLVYTGTEKDWDEAVDWAHRTPGSSFGNDVDRHVLGPLEKHAALGFLTGTAANLGVDIDPNRAGARILEQVGTWPFYLQVVGQAVVEAVQRNDRSPLTSTDALQELVERSLLDGWGHHFRSRWAEIGPAGRASLLRTPGEPPPDASAAGRMDLRDVGLLRPGERWLPDRPFFDWIARNAVSLRDGECP